MVLLKPGTNWKDASARFAVYFFNNSTSKNQWVGMTKVEGETDLYYAIAPSGTWKNLIYCRMNPGNATNDWGAKWNQSADLTWTNTKSLFTVANNSWDGATTTWSAKKVASTGKLTASSTNVSENEDVTLTPALTSNTAINTIQSTTYSISPATGASISGNTFTATAAGTYTVTATIKYRLNGYTSSTFDSTVDATTTITVTSAAEPKHDVLVSWKCGETELQASQTLNVGESTANTAEAPEFKDYTFSGWELGSGVQSVDATANPISITTKASGEYTLTAKYTYIEPVIKTIYCKMEYSWWTQASAAISAYISGTYGESTGVGTLMTLAPLESNVWKIDVDVARYQKIKFIRVNPTGTDNWGAYTGLVEIPVDDKNLYTITQSTEKWGSDCPGTWSVYEAPASAPKRYITGTIAGGWVGNEVEMTYDNALATYSHTFSALTVDTEYKLKVTDGTWTNHWGTINGTIDGVSNDGDGNICFALSTAGDVTVTFDGAKITLSTTGAFKVAVADPLATNVYLVGGMNSWNGTANEFKLAAVGDATASVTVTLPIGETAFKVTVNGDWHGNNGTMTRGECTGWTFNTSDGDCKINADAAGEYIFTWHIADKKLSVTYPALPAVDAYNVTVPAGTLECYISGSFDSWASFHKMTKVDETHYTISIPGATTAHTYKYSSGASWDFEEVTADGGHVDSRTYNADDVVAKWKAVYDPDAVPQELVYNVTVPAGTEACYIAMDSDPAQDGWEFTAMTKVDATHYTLTRTGLKTDAYKYACQASWDYAEKDADGNDVSNRTWNANDVVVKWGAPAPAVTKYYVVGSHNSWTADASSEMTKDGDVYTKEVTLSVGNEFKINVGDWTSSWGAQNLGGKTYNELEGVDNLIMKEAKTFTVIFNPAQNLITFTGLTESTPATPEPAKCYLMGIGGDWTTGIEMEVNPDNDNEFRLLCQPIAEGEQFKFKYGETWTTEVENHTENGVNWVETAPESGIYNITLPAGNYDFYFKKDIQKVWIGVCIPSTPTPDYTRTVTASNFGTICLPFGSSNYTGAIFYEIVGTQTGGIVLGSVDALVAGTPYIFRATAAELAVYSDGTTAATAGNSNGLHGTFDDNTEVVDNGDNHILYNNAICLVQGESCYVNANRAYVVMSEIPAGEPTRMPGRRYVSMGTQGTNATTGVDNLVVPEGQVLKVIENGQLIIIRDGEKFNVQGQKL